MDFAPHLISNQKFNTLVGEFYDAVLTGDWQSPMAKLASWTGATRFICLLTKTGDQQPLLVASSAETNNALTSELSHHNEGRQLQTSSAKSFDLAELIDAVSLIISDEAFSPIALSHVSDQHGASLISDGVYEGAFLVQKCRASAPFSERELTLLKDMTTHLKQAMKLFCEINVYQSYQTLSDDLLAKQDRALYVCDCHGRVAKVNQGVSKQKLVEAGITTTQGILTLSPAILDEQFKSLVKTCALDSKSKQQTLYLQGNEQTEAVITITPVVPSAFADSLSGQYCVVTIGLAAQLDWTQVQAEFSLTRSELVVLKGLHQNKSLKQLANSLEKSYHTLRSHLRNSMKKLQVHSQAELILKLNLLKQ